MLYLFLFFCINLTIHVAHPVFLMHIQSLLSGYAPATDHQVSTYFLLIFYELAYITCIFDFINPISIHTIICMDVCIYNI